MQVSSLTLPITATLVQEHPARAISLSESPTFSLQLAGHIDVATLVQERPARTISLPESATFSLQLAGHTDAATLVQDRPARATSFPESATFSLQLAGRTDSETLCRQIEQARPTLVRNTADGPVWKSDRALLARAYARAKANQDTDTASALAYRLHRLLSSPSTEGEHTPFPRDQQACVAALNGEQEADNSSYFAYDAHTG